MKKLIKHELDPELTWLFFLENLDNANALSIELLNHFKKEKGRFFTLLPKDANLDNLYRFNYGNILPQNPIKYGSVGSFGSQYYSETPSICEDLARVISDLLNQDENLSCIIDDVIRYSTDKEMKNENQEIKNCTAYSGKDVYYLLNKDNASFPLIVECLNRNRGYWHALSILSEFPFKDYVGKQLEKHIFAQICCNAQMIIIGAYDGEGYVIWERSQLP